VFVGVFVFVAVGVIVKVKLRVMVKVLVFVGVFVLVEVGDRVRVGVTVAVAKAGAWPLVGSNNPPGLTSCTNTPPDNKAKKDESANGPSVVPLQDARFV